MLTWILRSKKGRIAAETECGRFYIMRGLFGVHRLYDSRNHAAGGVNCDSLEEAQRLAERIASSRGYL